MSEQVKKTDAWMPLWIGDYLADTMSLNTAQHGAYLLLLIAYWRNKGPLHDDDEDLATIVRATPSEWKKLKPKMLRFFDVEDGTWSHSRANKELVRAGVFAQKAHDRAIKASSAKWGETDSQERGRHLRSQRLAEARKKGTHTAMAWELMKEFHGHQCVRCGAGGQMVKDHITPIYQGGSDGIENIQPMCKHCNSSKGPEAIDYRKDGWENACSGGISAGNKSLQDAFPTPSPSPSPITGTQTVVAEDGKDPHSARGGDFDDVQTVTATSAGVVCKAMRQAGLIDANPSHPKLRALIDAGASREEFVAAAIKAVQAQAGFAYALTIVANERKRAADLANAIHHGPLPNKQEAIERRNKAAVASWRPPELRDRQSKDSEVFDAS